MLNVENANEFFTIGSVHSTTVMIKKINGIQARSICFVDRFVSVYSSAPLTLNTFFTCYTLKNSVVQTRDTIADVISGSSDPTLFDVMY